MSTATPSGRPVVVITEQTDVDTGPGTALLESSGFEVVVLERGLAESRGAVAPARAADAIAAIVGFTPFGAAEFDLFPRLQLVCTTSTGTDMVDARAAAERGVTVRGLGGVSTQEVALHALALILASLRQLSEGRAVVATGGWTDELAGQPPAIGDLVLGLIGFGRIARETARISRPIFSRILATDPFVTEAEHGVELVALDELLATADIVSLHVPTTEESRGLISAERLLQLKPGALLVNVSRGELVDPAAVIAALDSGRLGGYAADVLESEPPAPDDPLRSHPKAIITPHMAFLSTASLRRYEIGPAEGIVDWMAAREAPAS